MNTKSEETTSFKYFENYPSGNMKVKGWLLDNEKEGEWIEFFENGNIKKIVNYSRGKKNGKYLMFKESGEIDFELNYLNGRLIFSIKTKKIIKPKGLGNY